MQIEGGAALSFADDKFDVAVLELPYIFGAQPGRKPVWMFVAEQIRNSKKDILDKNVETVTMRGE